MKKATAIILAIILLAGIFAFPAFADTFEDTETDDVVLDSPELDVNAKSAILMEASTKKIIYQKNSDEALPPASVTKIMTLLLVMEAISASQISTEDTVSISETAASMGGSQVFLKEGERMSVEELLKCTVIASANDAAVALAEHIAGSESAFVSMMNTKAKKMGLKNTAFENVTGLDDDTQYHLTSAADIAMMSAELIKYDLITKYSSTWQDTIRDGEFVLTNTNRLVRYYDGCNGLKTGSTDKAGFCVSTTAKRDGMQLIAVVMGADTKEDRNRGIRAMLDYGFANYAVFEACEDAIEKTAVHGSLITETELFRTHFSALVPKSKKNSIEEIYELPEYISAPTEAGATVGKIVYKLDGEKIGETSVIIKENLEKIGFWDFFIIMLDKIFINKSKK